MEADHYAFAERGFRGVLQDAADARGLHVPIADLLRRQRRFDDAPGELAPLLADPRFASSARAR